MVMIAIVVVIVVIVGVVVQSFVTVLPSVVVGVGMRTVVVTAHCPMALAAAPVTVRVDESDIEAQNGH
jgi:hypothetical protein